MTAVPPDPPRPLDRAAADAALAEAEAAVAGASGSLVALEEHPGYAVLLPGGLVGVSARRREETLATVAELHRDLALYRAAVARARGARGTSRRPGAGELAAVTHELLGPSVLLAEDEIPLQERGLLGPSHTERRTSAPALLARMTAAFDAVSAVVAAVARVWDDVVAQLAPLERASAELEDTGVAAATLRDAVDALRRTALADPLAHAGSRTPVPVDAVDALARRLAAARAAAADDARLQAGLPARVAAARTALDALAAAEDAAARTAAVASRDVVVTAAPAPRRAGELRAALGRAVEHTEAGRWDAARESFAALDAELAGAGRAAARDRELFGGLVERRAELRGRLRAFREKAVARGRAEDLALDALHTAAHDLLRAAPCDLAAATVAVRRYQLALDTDATSRT